MCRFYLLIPMFVALTGCNLHTGLDRPTGDAPVADSGTIDADNSDGGIVNSCTPQTDQDFCAEQGADCGEVTAFDNCGTSRTINCGTCSDGSTCGERQANVCGCPCEVDGTCVADGAINPDNSCEVCDPVANSTGWSPRTGVACTNDDLCAASASCTDQATCETNATIDCTEQVGECVDATCDPADGLCKGDPVADGTGCSDDGLTCTDDTCQAGTCEHTPQTGFCVVDGQCLGDGESPDGNSCVTCDTTTTPATLVNAASDTSCGPSLACATAACDGAGTCEFAVDSGTCAIDGACYNDGDMNPTNRCQLCDVTNSQTDWTDEPNGSSCKSPNCTCGTSPFSNEFTCLRPNDADCN